MNSAHKEKKKKSNMDTLRQKNLFHLMSDVVKTREEAYLY